MTDTKYEPADIEIYVKNKGLVLKEKSLVAFDPYSKKILGIGDEAQALAAQDLESVAVQSPLRQGLVADYTMADRMFRHMLQKAYGKKRFFKPNIAVGGIPRNITEVEKKAFTDLFYQVGAREVFLAECPLELLLQKIKTQELTAKWQKIKIFVSITKDEPIHYLKEQLSEALAYAKQEGIADSQVKEMLEDIINK